MEEKARRSEASLLSEQPSSCLLSAKATLRGAMESRFLFIQHFHLKYTYGWLIPGELSELYGSPARGSSSYCSCLSGMDIYILSLWCFCQLSPLCLYSLCSSSPVVLLIQLPVSLAPSCFIILYWIQNDLVRVMVIPPCLSVRNNYKHFFIYNYL